MEQREAVCPGLLEGTVAGSIRRIDLCSRYSNTGQTKGGMRRLQRSKVNMTGTSQLYCNKVPEGGNHEGNFRRRSSRDIAWWSRRTGRPLDKDGTASQVFCSLVGSQPAWLCTALHHTCLKLAEI